MSQGVPNSTSYCCNNGTNLYDSISFVDRCTREAICPVTRWCAKECPNSTQSVQSTVMYCIALQCSCTILRWTAMYCSFSTLQCNTIKHCTVIFLQLSVVHYSELHCTKLLPQCSAVMQWWIPRVTMTGLAHSIPNPKWCLQYARGWDRAWLEITRRRKKISLVLVISMRETTFFMQRRLSLLLRRWETSWGSCVGSRPIRC